MLNSSIFILVITVIYLHTVQCSQQKVYRSLIADKYVRTPRPVKDDTTTVMVEISLTRFYLESVDTAAEVITFILNYRLSWRDEFLIFDPKEFNGTEYFFVHPNEIWLPDVVMIHSINVRQLMEPSQLYAWVTSEGIVTTDNLMVITHKCPMHVVDYPFDVQNCQMNIVPWSFTAADLQLQFSDSGDAKLTHNTQGNSEWDIISLDMQNTPTPAELGSNATNVVLHLEMRRRSIYFVFVVILPVYCIAALCLLGLFSPFSNSGERQERVTLGLTTLLTMCVLLTRTAAEMPKSYGLPRLGYFILLEMALCAIAVLVSNGILFWHERALTGGWTVTHFLIRTLRLGGRKLFTPDGKCTVVLSTYKKDNYSPYLASATRQRKLMATQLRSMQSALHQFAMRIDALEAHASRLNNESAIRKQWKCIFKRIDTICLILFQFVNVFVAVFINLAI